MNSEFEDVISRLNKFAQDRDWEQFHSPKNLACSIVIEASELLEKFQWMSEIQSKIIDPEKLSEIESEVADIFSYLIYFAKQYDIDILKAASNKIELNEIRYPIDKSKGNAEKYTKLK